MRLEKINNNNTNILFSKCFAFNLASRKTEHLLSISTGGKLTDEAKKENIPVIKIPGGLQPRCALGYSFFPMLYVMMRAGAFKKEAVDISKNAIEELIPLLKAKTEIYSDFADNNPAIILASKLYRKVSVIYSALERVSVKQMILITWVIDV